MVTIRPLLSELRLRSRMYRQKRSFEGKLQGIVILISCAEHREVVCVTMVPVFPRFINPKMRVGRLYLWRPPFCWILIRPFSWQTKLYLLPGMVRCFVRIKCIYPRRCICTLRHDGRELSLRVVSAWPLFSLPSETRQIGQGKVRVLKRPWLYNQDKGERHNVSTKYQKHGDTR